MSDQETRKWAAKWLGNGYTAQLNGTYVTHADAGATYEISDTDLAEAVRVKCLQDDALGECPSVDKGRVRWIWWSQGPLAFIAAVREVVE